MTKKLKTLKALKITSLIIFCLITVVIAVIFFSVIKSLGENVDGTNDFGVGLGIAVCLIISELICIAYFIPSIISIVSLCISRKIKSAKNKLFLIPMALSPIIMAAVTYLAYFIVIQQM